MYVEDFGAIGDGVTADTEAIQAAIDNAASLGTGENAGGVVRFVPSKTYLTGQLQMKTGVTLYGGPSAAIGYPAVPGRATLRPDGLTSGQFLIVQAAGEVRDIALMGLKLLGSGHSSETGAIHFDDVKGVTLKSVHAYLWGIQAGKLTGTATQVTHVSNCLFQGCRNRAFSAALGHVAGFEVAGVDHHISQCEFAGGCWLTVHDAADFKIAGFKCTAFNSFITDCVMETGDCGQSHFGANNTYISCRWDTNAGHGWYACDTLSYDNVFIAPRFGRNSYALDNTYDNIHIPDNGMGRCRIVGALFYANNRDNETPCLVRYNISDARPELPGYFNSYDGASGDAGATGFYNVTGGSSVSQIEANFRTLTGATPSVLNGTRFNASNGGATTITNFLNGTDGQDIIVFGDGNTTIQASLNIATPGGGNLLLALNEWVRFVKRGAVWQCVGLMVRKPAIATPATAAAAPTQAEFNAVVAAVTALLNANRDAGIVSWV